MNKLSGSSKSENADSLISPTVEDLKLFNLTSGIERIEVKKKGSQEMS